MTVLYKCRICGEPARLVGEGEGTCKGFLSGLLNGDPHVHDPNRYSGEFVCEAGCRTLGDTRTTIFYKPCPVSGCDWKRPGEPLVIS